MPGIYGSIGTSLFAPAAAALPGGRAGGRPRGIPSASLSLSAALHFGALALVLLLHARSALPEAPKIELRVWPLPPPTILLPLDPLPAPPRGGSEASDGIIVPRPELDLKISRTLPGETGPVLPDPPGRGEPAPGPAGVANAAPGASPVAEMPSVYEEPPQATHAPDPEYPPLARDAGIEGMVVVEALVGREGGVLKTRVREGDPILADAAEEAVRGWRFRPAQWNGRGVTAWVAIPVVFRLR